MINPAFKKFVVLDKTFIKERYNDFIDFLFEFSDSLMIVVRNDLPQSDNCKLLLDKLENNKIKTIKSNTWAFTIVESDKYVADIFYYRLNFETRNILLEMSNSLNDWVQPNLPEDICFLKNNKYTFISCVHENIFSILKEYDEKLSRFKG